MSEKLDGGLLLPVAVVVVVVSAVAVFFVQESRFAFRSEEFRPLRTRSPSSSSSSSSWFYSPSSPSSSSSRVRVCSENPSTAVCDQDGRKCFSATTSSNISRDSRSFFILDNSVANRLRTTRFRCCGSAATPLRSTRSSIRKDVRIQR